MADAKLRLYLVIPGDGYPKMPTAQIALYTSGSGYNTGYQIVGIGGVAPPPAIPYILMANRDEAHIKAKELSKAHHIAFHVAEVHLLGKFNPPPPEWQPHYEEDIEWSQTWSKP